MSLNYDSNKNIRYTNNTFMKTYVIKQMMILKLLAFILQLLLNMLLLVSISIQVYRRNFWYACATPTTQKWLKASVIR